MFIPSAHQEGNQGQRITPPRLVEEGVGPIVPLGREHHFVLMLMAPLGEVVRGQETNVDQSMGNMLGAKREQCILRQ